MSLGCMVCGERDLRDSEGRCSICGTSGNGMSCGNAHHVCQICMDTYAFRRIADVCLASTSDDPYLVFKDIMDDGVLRMHDFKHHVAVGASLLAAHRNSGFHVDLEGMLDEMVNRGRKVPPGSCGYMGNCGAAVSVGIFLSILTGTTPYSEDTWGDVNLATAQCLIQMALIGGPRCCKRNSYVALGVGASLAREKFGSEMSIPEGILCQSHESNKECIKERCPFYCGSG